MRLSVRHRLVITFSLAAFGAHADTVADWADKTTDLAIEGPNTIRTMALAQNAVYVAVNAITAHFPKDRVDLGPVKGASIDAAIAASSRMVLLHEAPALQSRIDGTYVAALELIGDEAARLHGIAVGEAAAAHVLAKHTDDLGNPQPYRPLTPQGVFVPTTFPLGVAVSQHKPWILKSADQFRPGPPPALTSERWARDYNETKSLGALNSKERTPEQTTQARFWATALPDVYLGILRSVDLADGRDVTRNARLYAAVMAALNEAEIAVFEAKYVYQFWRPLTAIRNGDRDENPATERDPAWLPLIVTPLQPEYPCGHCILSATVATVIRADVGRGASPILRTTSNTLPGVTREWPSPEDMAHEVANARIYDGVHFRSSAEAGAKMGEKIGAVVADFYRLP
jgi:PAP2 superfamily